MNASNSVILYPRLYESRCGDDRDERWNEEAAFIQNTEVVDTCIIQTALFQTY